MLEHRREDRERKHLFITDQHCSTLMIDVEDAGRAEAKGNAASAERLSHANQNRDALVKHR